MEYVIANEKRNRKEMAELKLLMKSRLMGEGKQTATPSTHRERYQKLAVKRVPMLPAHFGKRPDWASLFAADPPRPGSSESRTVQPFWSSIIPQLPRDEVVLVDKHSTVSFGTCNPDIVGYLAGQPKSVAHIVLIGELKARRSAGKDDFDDEEKGHLESFLEELLLNYQPWRSSMFGFLSDGVLIQFFRLVVRPKKELYEGKPMQLVEDGARGLATLLESPNYNGLQLEIRGAPVRVKSYLGSGGSAIVFSGKYKGEEVVIKRFNEDRVAALSHSRHEFERMGDVLILQPVGDKFASSVNNWDHALANRDDFVQLINILEQAHKKCGLVHRDVRLNNFFRIKGTTQVFLNDWGSAAAAGVLADFDGALQHAPDEILDSWESGDQYRPAFSHDLEMVVRTVFHSTNMMTFREIEAEEDVQKLRAFWAHHLEPAVWQRMLQAAQACQYAALKAIIAELLPGQVPLPPLLITKCYGETVVN
ncbi:uncharacterized protein ACA1_096710 [Acanthamoeba castellanii str. Neff]|uniref:Protein kinase domain-containing protein n=1 Tax=Acanthamoeba castellanii (strain ATCC 30010 / Neff) TaxID=1257118 RepID=L8GJJ4_ACACF|nr:uncharacterized protein ACA1_096710 [Acanthamoeba castellanii str. Neff]ELR12999.1 hypothetical protein ACA1_096710 [Acanthamoeba castellanii str. Neff]